MIISNIERVSALYLTKTIYSRPVKRDLYYYRPGLPVCAYPPEPDQRGRPLACQVFFLALEQTETVTQDGFLKNVLQVALPGALVMVISMLRQSGSWNIFRAEFRCFVCL